MSGVPSNRFPATYQRSVQKHQRPAKQGARWGRASAHQRSWDHLPACIVRVQNRAELTSGAGAAPRNMMRRQQRQLRHQTDKRQDKWFGPGQVRRLRAAPNQAVHLKDGRHYPQPPSPDSNRRARSCHLPGTGQEQERARAHQRSWACRRNSSNKHSQQDTHTREEKSTQNTTKQQQKDKTRHGSSVVAG